MWRITTKLGMVISRGPMWVNTTSALSAGRQGACTQFSKNARRVGRLGSGPRLVAERVDVVPANRADRANVVFRPTHTPRVRAFWSAVLHRN